MGRPPKQDAEWFRHDKDMRNDLKIRALRRRFGAEGYSIWCMTLEVLTDSDGIIAEITPVNTELLAADFEVDVKKLLEVWDYCVELGLLQRDMETATLTCVNLSARLEALFEKRKLDSDRQAAILAARKARIGILAARTQQNTSSRGFYPTEQSRVEKSREEQQLVANLDTSARAREDTPTRGEAENATPPAAALSVPALKKRLADASILTTPAELENIAALLIAKSVDCETFIAWALAKAAKARQPSSWFAKGLLEWDWIGKWRAEGGGPPRAETPYVLELHTPTPEDDAEVERLAAEARARLHMVAPAAGVVEGSTNELDAIPF